MHLLIKTQPSNQKQTSCTLLPSTQHSYRDPAAPSRDTLCSLHVERSQRRQERRCEHWQERQHEHGPGTATSTPTKANNIAGEVVPFSFYFFFKFCFCCLTPLFSVYSFFSFRYLTPFLLLTIPFLFFSIWHHIFFLFSPLLNGWT